MTTGVGALQHLVGAYILFKKTNMIYISLSHFSSWVIDSQTAFPVHEIPHMPANQ